ncbi:CvpA family protein [Ktedonobacter racemifer]|uniref:Colicin V production protein n=1 Tax=Ktedonobacter racemifer DSM 44963 TaxID=485913 RepID=D6TMZ8_KTERA|nr:CvpA family protein [Ktedonobacter racemifer]EFH87148.1 hypothetical protein Krac_8473 [Ktedonobacter racemifer DSM 44963]
MPDLFHLSVIDILFVLTVLLMVFNGIRNGAIFSLINIISIPIGWFVAYAYGPEFISIMASDGFAATPLIAFLALFLGVVLIFHIAATLIRGTTHRIPGVGLGDALLGGLVGFVESWLLWLLLLIVLGNFLASAQSGVPLGMHVDAAQLRAWHDFYNDAVNNSLFARVNAFFVHALPPLPQPPKSFLSPIH